MTKPKSPSIIKKYISTEAKQSIKATHYTASKANHSQTKSCLSKFLKPNSKK